MKRTAEITLMIVVVTAAACTGNPPDDKAAGGGASNARAEPGMVLGLVLEAARSDVLSPGVARVDRRPLATRGIAILDRSNHVVRTLDTSRTGRFRVALEPGRYTAALLRDRGGTNERSEVRFEVVSGDEVRVRLVDHVCYCG